MNSRNLIPARRLQLKKQQRSIRRWLLLDGIYLAALIAVGCIFVATAMRSQPEDNPRSIRSEIDRANATVAVLNKNAASLNSVLQANNELSETPDWSVLLAALSDSLGQDMVLTRIECKIKPGSKGNSSTSTAQSLQVSGMGRSQESVTQFILRLEQLRFFKSVKLVETTPQTLSGIDVVNFELICDLPGGSK